jgi:hypothetical protein
MHVYIDTNTFHTIPHYPTRQAPGKEFDYSRDEGCLGICLGACYDGPCPFLGCHADCSSFEAEHQNTDHTRH